MTDHSDSVYLNTHVSACACTGTPATNWQIYLTKGTKRKLRSTQFYYNIHTIEQLFFSTNVY